MRDFLNRNRVVQPQMFHQTSLSRGDWETKHRPNPDIYFFKTFLHALPFTFAAYTIFTKTQVTAMVIVKCLMWFLFHFQDLQEVMMLQLQNFLRIRSQFMVQRP